MALRLDYVAIVVEDLEAAMEFFRAAFSSGSPKNSRKPGDRPVNWRDIEISTDRIVQFANTARLWPMKKVWSWPLLGSAGLYFVLVVPSGT